MVLVRLQFIGQINLKIMNIILEYLTLYNFVQIICIRYLLLFVLKPYKWVQIIIFR